MTATSTQPHPEPAPSELRLYEIPEVMAMLQLSRSTIYEQIRARRLRIVKQGRSTRVTPAAIADYIKLLERESDDEVSR